MGDESKLVEFASPPVVEALIAAEYPLVPELDSLTLLDLQRSWSEDLPIIELREVLPPMGAIGPIVRLQQGAPDFRVWASNDDTGLLVQLQPGRIAVNWRRREGGADYPRFAGLLSEFERRWDLVGRRTSLGELPAPSLVEFAYVNRIGLGDAEAIEDVLRVAAHDGPGERVQDDLHIVRKVTEDGYPDRHLEVTASARHDVEADEGVLNLTILVRCLAGPAVEDWKSLVHKCRADARLMFQSLTTAEAHEKWGRV